MSLQVAESIADVAVRSAAAFEEELPVPVDGEAHVEVDGVVLAVDARAFVDLAADFTMGGQSGNTPAPTGVALDSTGMLYVAAASYFGTVIQPIPGVASARVFKLPENAVTVPG